MESKLRLIPVAGTKNRVFIEPVKRAEKVSAGGLFLPVGQDEPKYEFYGKVLAVSERDETGIEPNVKAGDTVFFGANFTTENFEGIEYFLMKEGNIYGKL